MGRLRRLRPTAWPQDVCTAWRAPCRSSGEGPSNDRLMVLGAPPKATSECPRRQQAPLSVDSGALDGGCSGWPAPSRS